MAKQSLSDIVLSMGTSFEEGAVDDVVDIITFVESPMWMGTTLFPVQRVILKAHYGIPLDESPPGLTDEELKDFDLDTLQKLAIKEDPKLDHDLIEDVDYLIRVIMRRTVTVYLGDAPWRKLESERKHLTEAEYLRYMYDRGRCNLREVVPGEERREMMLSVGRRSGKTHMSSCIAAYETYKLISKNNPQKYYGLPEGEVIQLISVATERDQAGILYRKVSAHFKNTQFFRGFTANETQTNTRFQTPKDITDYGKYTSTNGAHASLNITFRSCVAKGLRGAGNIVVILDEVAHFTGDGQSSAEEVYEAVRPSMSTMARKDPNDKSKAIGDVESRMILISSPQGKQGLFYRQFQRALQGGKGSENLLAIQAPTWEVNPSLPASEFEDNYARDPNVFRTEYGGEFSDRTMGWIEVASDLLDCIEPSLYQRQKGLARTDHFMGIDFALKNDGTAVAIGHLDGDKIVVDYVDSIRAGVPGPYENHERLDFDEVADWILSLTKKFRIKEGLFDQWCGIVFEQALAKRGLVQLKSENHSDQFSSLLFKNFKDMMYEKRLVLYDDRSEAERNERPDDEGVALDPNEEDGPQEVSYLKELLSLQAHIKSKYITKVQAPQVKGKHDDRSDALVRMVWLASNAASKYGYMSGGSRHHPGSDPHAQLEARKAALRAKRKARQGYGTHASRRVPKQRRRR